MTVTRTLISNFNTANRLYAGAVVTAYGITGGVKDTDNIVPSYAGISGTDVLANPQTLDSEGKWVDPPYIEEPVILDISGPHVGSHDTGVIHPHDAAPTLATATSGITAINLGDRFDHVLNVDDFGAAGDGVADDTGAINLAFALVRNSVGSGVGNFLTTRYTVRFSPGKTYRVDSSINATEIGAYYNFYVEGNGAVIDGHCTGKAVVDAMGCAKMNWRNLLVRGDVTDKPSIGLQIGRVANESREGNSFDNVRIVGYFTVTGLYNLACELTTYRAFHVHNKQVDKTSYCAWFDGDNSAAITSDYVTITTSGNKSFNRNHFTSCSFRKIESVAGLTGDGNAIRYTGSALRDFRFESSLMVTLNESGMDFADGVKNFYVDMHHETNQGTIPYSVYFSGTGVVECENFVIRDQNPHSDTALIGKAGAGALKFYNSEIHIPTTFNGNLPLFDPADNIQFHGTIDVGDEAALLDISSLSRFDGIFITKAPAASVTMPTTGSFHVYGIGDRIILRSQTLFQIDTGSSTMKFRVGSGTPEGSIIGTPPDLYFRDDGGAGTAMYIKESGAGTNTGWVAK